MSSIKPKSYMFNKFFSKKVEETEESKLEPIIRQEGAEVITMPKMSSGMKYGVISKWLVQEGDVIRAGDIFGRGGNG